MKALSTLSKFTGRHDLWKQTIKKYNLLWSTGDNSLSIFNKILNETSYFDMLKWIKEVIALLPKLQGNLIVFNTLSGLRPIEVAKCIGLLHSSINDYWNKDKGILEHYKFPNLFIRRTKKAFISVATNSMIKLSKNCSDGISYNALKLTLHRRGMEMNMYYCRKVFATFLRNEEVEPEIIDLLQGRIPNSVFVRHYYRPDASKFDKVRMKLDKLHDILLD
jgi:intergrase/recombinase